MSKISYVIIRFTMAALFLWFGTQQILHTSAWIGFLPEWAFNMPLSPERFVLANGMFEVVSALLLIAGLFTRWVAAALGAHLLMIALTVGGDIGVRDAALGLTAIAMFFTSPDAWTLDARRSSASSSMNRVG